MKKINKLSALLFFVLAITLSGCSVLGKSGNRGCGCPSVHKKAVG